MLWLCASGVALAEPSNSTVLYYHHDFRGDPVVVTKETGEIQWIESYRAYGSAEPRVSSAGIGFGDNASENHSSRLGYTGHEKDSTSGLTYMKARYYDGLTGRFLSNDPVGFNTANPMSFNRYSYGNNNPLKYVDPDGRQVIDITLRIEVITPNGTDLALGYSNPHEPFADLKGSRRIRGGGLSARIAKGAIQSARSPNRPPKSVNVGIGKGVPKNGKQFSGYHKPWTSGATPNSTYTHIDPKTGKAKQNAIYDADGNVEGHVDFKNQGKGAPSGHGHQFPEPGNPASGHGPSKPYIPNDQLPSEWDKLPPGVQPHTPIGN